MTGAFLQMMRPRERGETESQAARRKHRAFELVYPRCRRIVMSVCSKNHIDFAEREDLLQQTMLELFTAVQERELDGRCTVFTFAYTIAHRRSVDLIRKQLHRGEAEANAEQSDRVEAGWDTAACAQAALKDVEVAHPRWFEVFVLMALGNLSSEEAAETLGVSAAWLRNILVAIRKTIRESCVHHCGVEDCTEVRPS